MKKNNTKFKYRTMKFTKPLFLALSLAFTLCTTQAQTIREGVTAIDYDKNELASQIFTKLTAAEPTNGLNFYYLGRAYINLLKPELAKKAFEDGTKAEPNNPANYAGLGELLLEEGKVNEANVYFDKALSFSKGRDGKVQDVNALRVVALAMTTPETKLTDKAVELADQALQFKPAYDTYLIAGDVYLEKADGGKAASLYERAIEMAPNDPKAYVKVANIWLRVRNSEATLNELNRALKIDSNYAPVLKALAEYYSQTRQFAKARTYFERYLQNSENSVSNKTRYAKLLFRNKDYSDALNVILDIRKEDSSDVYLMRLAGYCYYEVGNEKKDTSLFRPGMDMLERFMLAIEPAKILSNDYEYLGKIYSRVPGKDSLAALNISKALEIDPNKVELYKEAGLIYYRTKRFDLSIISFETFLAKSPKIVIADYYYMGLAYYYGKLYGKADTAFSKVIELKKDYPDGYYWKANCNVQLDVEGKSTVAKENFEKYISLTEAAPDKYKKNLIASYNYLAKFAIKQDDNTGAKDLLNKILALDPENKDAKDILKQMEAPKKK